jgi:mono/diheme cytochrome c family protein
MFYHRVICLITWFVVTGVPLQLPAEAQQHIPGASVHVGQQYFQQYCSACHGLSGRGNGPVAPALKIPPADLTRIAQHRGGQFPEADIAAIIDGRTSIEAHGSREMPVWGQRFSDQFGGGAVGDEAVRGHLLVLIDYLKSIQQ